jgi:hypothetical protein
MKIKFLQSLGSLDRREMSRFVAFVHSPYHNKHEGVRCLVSYLDGLFPDFSGANCSPGVMEKVVMNRADIAGDAFAPILTYAQRLFEAFLINEGLKDDDLARRLYLLRGLRGRKLFSQYERQLGKARRKLEKSERRDALQLQFRYQLGVETGDYVAQRERRQADTSLQSRQDAFDLYFISEKLRDACELQVRRQILAGEYNLLFLEPILQEIRLHPDRYRPEPAVYIYYALYQMLREEASTYYFQALESIREHRQAFNRAELITIYNYLMNFCIARINRNDGRFLQELFTLYKLQLSDDLLLEDGFLSEWDYKNIVTTALRLGELSWAKTFIEDYRESLLPASRDNAFRFNKASYHYAAGEYDQVLALLTKVEYSDLRYSLGTRALLMRTYYDLDEYDALHALTESFRQYLQRNQLMSDIRRLGYYNLFRLTRKTALLRTRFPYLRHEKIQHELIKIREEVDATKEVFNRSWLLEKLAELENSALVTNN